MRNNNNIRIQNMMIGALIGTAAQATLMVASAWCFGMLMMVVVGPPLEGIPISEAMETTRTAFKLAFFNAKLGAAVGAAVGLACSSTTEMRNMQGN